MGLAERVGDRLGIPGRHANFHAKVEIVELGQVPLVNAKFCVKWKFKTAVTSSSHAFPMGMHSEPRSSMEDGGATTEEEDGRASGRGLLSSLSGGSVGSTSGERSRVRRGSYSAGEESPHRDSADDSSSSYRPLRDYLSGLPMSPVSPPSTPQQRNGKTMDPNKTPTPAHTSVFSNPFSSNNTSLSTSPASPKGYISSSVSPSDTPQPKRRGATQMNANEIVTDRKSSRVEPKGVTSFQALRSHMVVFKTELRCPVSIQVRSSAQSIRPQLQPAPLKLTVKQEVKEHAGKKSESKIGYVMLDLSQFVVPGGKARHGKASEKKAEARRYLLKDSKTNAVLRVSVVMEWISGETDFVPPPLKTGQISSSSNPSTSSIPSFNNRSSTSVNSRRPPSIGGMSRTNSTSSMRSGTPSVRSMTTPPSQSATKTWQPPTSNFSVSSSTFGLAGNGHATGAEHTASEIIDKLFNTAAPPSPSMSRQGSSASFRPRQPPSGKIPSGVAPPLTGRNSEALFMSTRKRNSGSSDKITPKQKSPLKLPFASSSSSNRPSFSPTYSVTSQTSQSASSPPIIRRPTAPRDASTASRTRSVRWTDSDHAEMPSSSQSSSSTSLSKQGPPLSREGSSSDLVEQSETDEDADLEDETELEREYFVDEKGRRQQKSKRSKPIVLLNGAARETAGGFGTGRRGSVYPDGPVKSGERPVAPMERTPSTTSGYGHGGKDGAPVADGPGLAAGEKIQWGNSWAAPSAQT